LTDPSHPALKGGSRKLLLLAALFCLIALMGAVWLFWTFFAPTPLTIAPPDSLNQAASSQSAPGELTIHLDQSGAPISPTLYGLALEQVNHSLDGGLYAELLSNQDLANSYSVYRTTPQTVGGLTRVVNGNIVTIVDSWNFSQIGGAKADMELDPDPTAPGPKTSLRLTVSSAGSGGRAGIYNGGYAGIAVFPSQTYHASFYAKAGVDFSGPLVVSIRTRDDQTVFASAAVENIDHSWRRYDVDLKTPGNITPSYMNNIFEISTSRTGTVWLAEMSLFPPTWNNRPNGNRADLMQLLADLKPGFIVYPGGDELLGQVPGLRFDWKKSIGPLEARVSQPSVWERMSNGFGLMEFLLTCEDLHAQPVLGIYDGTSRGENVKPGIDLAPYVQDALDEIEYVTGDKSATWGARRAADGHPDPFPLHYLQIGNNEQIYNERTYDARFTQFHDAIKGKYPSLKLIGWMDLATTRRPDVSHTSFYSPAREILHTSSHYDNLFRGGPRCATEVNAKGGDPGKSLFAALADMSWMLGVQRNADLVTMATVAPTFVNCDAGTQEYPPDLIPFNNLLSYGSPSYYAMQMFNLNKGDTVIPIDFTPPEIDAPAVPSLHGAIGLETWSTQVEFRDIKVTDLHGKVLYQTDSSTPLTDWRIGDGTWQMEHGVLSQTSDLIDCTAVAGDANWTDYTLTLKARKLGGIEGFLILVRAADSGNCVWWDLGGWNDSTTGLGETIEGDKVFPRDVLPNRIDPGRWYDIRVQVKGQEIVCWLDNAPIFVGKQRPHAAASGPMSAAASRDSHSGEVILKLVNPTPCPAAVNINLAGTSAIADEGTLEVMQGLPGDVNTFNAPRKIAPTTINIHFPGNKFSHEFPPYSISVLRMMPK